MTIKKLKPYQIAILVFVAVLAIILVSGGTYCVVNDKSPKQLVKQIITGEKEPEMPDPDSLIGKWQEEKSIIAYEFFEDGKYDFYFLGNHTKKLYKVEDDLLILMSNTDNTRVVYQFTIEDDGYTLYLKLVEEGGVRKTDGEWQKFSRVEHINVKEWDEAIQEAAEEIQSEDTSQSE